MPSLSTEILNAKQEFIFLAKETNLGFEIKLSKLILPQQLSSNLVLIYLTFLEYSKESVRKLKKIKLWFIWGKENSWDGLFKVRLDHVVEDVEGVREWEEEEKK